jgi:hypothetical protein
MLSLAPILGAPRCNGSTAAGKNRLGTSPRVSA